MSVFPSAVDPLSGGDPEVTSDLTATETEVLADEAREKGAMGETGLAVNALGVVGATCTLKLGVNTLTTGASNVTATLPTAVVNGRVRVVVTQGATARTWTATGSLNPAGTGLALTATAAAVDILDYWSDGTSWYGTQAIKNFS